MDNKRVLIVVEIIVVILIISCFTANSIVNQLKHELLEVEISNKLPPLLDLGKSFAEKVFDINRNEGWGNSGAYRARELAYVVDILDCKFISFCFDHGFPCFISLFFYLSIFVISIAHYFLNRKVLKNGFLFAILLLILFYTSPCIFFAGGYMRSSKIGASVCVYLLLVLLYKLGAKVKDQSISNFTSLFKENIGLYMSVFIISLIGSLFDEQGFFIIACVSIISLMLFIIFKQKHYFISFVVILFATLLYLLYSYLLGPYLIFKVVGYHPDFSFRNFLNGNHSIIMDGLTIESLRVVIMLFFDMFRFFVGNIALWLSYFLYLLLSMMLYRNITDKVQEKRSRLLAGLLILISNVFIIVMLLAMYIRFSLIANYPAVRRIYYVLPVTTMIFFVLSIVVSKVNRKYIKNLIVIVLLIFISNNILELPNHGKIIKDHLKRYSIFTKYILDNLKQRYDRKVNDYVFQSSDGNLINMIRHHPAVMYLFVVKEAKRKR